MSPLVAEVYGINYPGQIQAARQVRAVFSATPDIIDVDDTVEAPSERLIAHVDQAKAALLGVCSRRSPPTSTLPCAARMPATCTPKAPSIRFRYGWNCRP